MPHCNMASLQKISLVLVLLGQYGLFWFWLDQSYHTILYIQFWLFRGLARKPRDFGKERSSHSAATELISKFSLLVTIMSSLTYRATTPFLPSLSFLNRLKSGISNSPSLTSCSRFQIESTGECQILVHAS